MSHHLRLFATPLIRVCWGDIAVKCINVSIRASERRIVENNWNSFSKTEHELFLEPSLMWGLPWCGCQLLPGGAVKTCEDMSRLHHDHFEPDGFPVVFCRHFWLVQFRPSWRWVILCLLPLPYRNTRNPVYRIPAYYAIVCHCTTCTFQTCSKMFSSFLTNL